MPLSIQNEGTRENIVLMGGGENEGISSAGGEDASALHCFWTPTRIVAILVLLVDVGGYALCVYFAHQRRKKIKALRGEQEEDSTTSSTGGGGDILIFWFGHDDTSCLSGDLDDDDDDNQLENDGQEAESMKNDYPVIEIEWLKEPSKQTMSVDTGSESSDESSSSSSSSLLHPTVDEETGLLLAGPSFTAQVEKKGRSLVLSNSYGSTAYCSNSD